MKVIDVNKEQKRNENWALRNSCQDCLNYRTLVINWYTLFSIGQIKTEPVLCYASYPIVLRFSDKYLMINRIFKYPSSTPSMELTLSWWGGLSTKKFQPECINEENSTEHRS